MTQKKEQHKILINAVDPEECRIALVKGEQLENFSIETIAGEITRGNIYKGKVTGIQPSLQAAFIDYGQRETASYSNTRSTANIISTSLSPEKAQPLVSST